MFDSAKARAGSGLSAALLAALAAGQESLLVFRSTRIFREENSVGLHGALARHYRHSREAEPVNLRFRVGPGFHVNSNKPKSEFLIPTVLKLSAPTDIVIGRVTYPAGSEMSFAFAPEDKLSVYTGEFPVVVEVRPLAERDSRAGT